MYSVIVLIHSISERFAWPTGSNQLWAGKPYWATLHYEEVGGI